jgi:hypothetical protein
MKLKEWADKHKLSYLTANRQFHAGLIPNAFQMASGTILVDDEYWEQDMASNTSGDAISLFLKKTVEFSKNNSTVEDFAAYIISNFQLKLNNSTETPRYSRNKPQPEDVQNHFKQFLPDKESQEHLKAIKNLIKEGPQPGDIVATPEMMNEIMNEFNIPGLIEEPVDDASVLLYETATNGLVSRSVDLNNTPQQINYTGSNSQPVSQQSFDASLQTLSYLATNFAGGVAPVDSVITTNSIFTPTASCFNAGLSPFQPTQQETLAVSKVIEVTETNETLPKRRGRKPSKAFK